jgi:hypothetical protein
MKSMLKLNLILLQSFLPIGKAIYNGTTQASMLSPALCYVLFGRATSDQLIEQRFTLLGAQNAT